MSSSDVAIIISFCAALASAGTYLINWRRIRMEAAKLVVLSLTYRQEEGEILLRVCNVGSRAAFDIEIAFDDLRVSLFVEGLKSGDDREFRLSGEGLPSRIIISYDDVQIGRVAEARSIMTGGSGLLLGRRKKVRPGSLGETHALSGAAMADAGGVVVADGQLSPTE